MKLKEIIKKEKGRFINRYDLVYELESGNEKVYEMVSRNKNLETPEDITETQPTAVVIIATDDEGRILLNKEFRMAVGKWVYNFPAGLIDPGENPEVAAKRELWEETGLSLDEITEILGPSYSTVGFSEELTVSVICKASGEFGRSTSEEEEIVPGWYTEEEVLEIVKTQPVAARTQAYCYAWANNR